MTKNITKLAKQLIRFPTTEDNQKAKKQCFNFIINYLKNSRLKIKKIITPIGSALYITNTTTKPIICLVGHIDVVPGNYADYIPKIIGNKLFGRGAIDMKGSVAVLIEVIKNAPAGTAPLSLLLVDDEEKSTGTAARVAIQQLNLRPHFTIVAEQTDFNLVTQQKGTVNVTLTYRGRAAHSAEPQNGVNALDKLIAKITQLQNLPLWKTKKKFRPTISLTTLAGGEAKNSIPATATATLNIRYTNGEDKRQLLNGIKKIKEPRLKIGCVVKPLMTVPKNNCNLQRLKKLLDVFTCQTTAFEKSATGSDAKYFSEAGLPVVVFGPIGRNYHAKNEWADLKSLESYYSILNQFINSYS